MYIKVEIEMRANNRISNDFSVHSLGTLFESIA